MINYIKKILFDLSKFIPPKWIAGTMFLGAVIGMAIKLKAIPSLQKCEKIFSSDDFLSLVSIPISLIAMAFLIRSMLNYLEGNTSLNRNKDEKVEHGAFHMGLDIETILKNALKSSLIDDATGFPNMNPVASRFPTTDQTDSLQSNFIEKLQYDLKHSQRFNDLILLHNELKSQIARLVSNSNINVTIGMSTTVIALSVLFFSIYTQGRMNNTLEFLQYFVPRLTTVIVIEVISFFFLKLYKNNLSEIKYFQNEITNLNFKLCALKSAIYQGDDGTAAAIMLQFAATERNFILQKGQSTERLELLKIEQKGEKNLTDAVKGMFNKAEEN